MRKQEVDHILNQMLDSHDNVSDLNFTVGKPLQVESSENWRVLKWNPISKNSHHFRPRFSH